MYGGVISGEGDKFTNSNTVNRSSILTSNFQMHILVSYTEVIFTWSQLTRIAGSQRRRASVSEIFSIHPNFYRDAAKSWPSRLRRASQYATIMDWKGTHDWRDGHS